MSLSWTKDYDFDIISLDKAYRLPNKREKFYVFTKVKSNGAFYSFNGMRVFKI